MKSGVSIEMAKRYLSPVPEGNRFFCTDGKILSTLDDLDKYLNEINPEVFKYHLNEEKNDFSSWIYDVIGDVELADSVRNCKNKTSLAKKLKARIKFLRSLK